MLEIIFVGKTSQAHLLVMDPQTHPKSSTKRSFEESSEHPTNSALPTLTRLQVIML
ncbi:hypothetical protein A2U01_0061268, partial [Trifolium medium]|nr:hypothetical protein [Trifolium medium]